MHLMYTLYNSLHIFTNSFHWSLHIWHLFVCLCTRFAEGIRRDQVLPSTAPHESLAGQFARTSLR